MYDNKFGMFETPGFSVDFPVCIRETGRNPLSGLRSLMILMPSMHDFLSGH